MMKRGFIMMLYYFIFYNDEMWLHHDVILLYNEKMWLHHDVILLYNDEI